MQIKISNNLGQIGSINREPDRAKPKPNRPMFKLYHSSM